MRLLCIIVSLALSMPFVAAAEESCGSLFVDENTVFRWEYTNVSTNRAAVRTGRFIDNDGFVSGTFGPWALSAVYTGARFRFTGTSTDRGDRIKGNGECTRFGIIGEFGYLDGRAHYNMSFVK